MKGKRFHLGDVLSITTGRLLSPQVPPVSGLYEILNFMTGDDLSTLALGRASKKCKPSLLKQFPQLATAEMKSALRELEKELRWMRKDPPEIVKDWLAKQIAKYGEMLEVKPLPKGTHKVKDQITEALEMGVDRRKILVVKT